MGSRVWVLVEWVDESNVLPSYGVVNVDTSAYSDNDLVPGNFIFLRIKHENPKRAKILRISENKRYVKEHKEVLERQDQQVKNMLQLCMRTIKEIKTENSFNSEHHLSSHSALPHVVVAKHSNSDSDSDLEPDTPRQSRKTSSANKILHTQTPRPPTKHNRKEVLKNHTRTTFNENQQIRRGLVSSTPISGSASRDDVKLFFDQATQTEGTYLQPPMAKIEEMEAVLKNLYMRFQALVTQVNTNSNGTPSVSGSEHNDEVPQGEPTVGQLWADPDNPEYLGDQPPENGNNNGGGQEAEDNVEEPPVTPANIKIEGNTPNTLRIRRMSAQTTNNIETVAPNDLDMVAIGHGNAKVPVRLLTDIDWNWYTSATRQLLQAIFPRKVLATHSLTGKQSPAFMNRPPKKILDPKLVEDIVMTVSNRCGVPKNLVRNSITIKCTDEAKLYRNRQQYKQGGKPLQNEENVPPSTPSSDESTNVVMN